MPRAGRLLELMIRLRAAPRLTVRELAEEFGVSRRTMLRDLHALSEIGVPLSAAPGPGGGYALARDQRLPPLALTIDEALGLLLSHEAFLGSAPSPFAAEHLSAITKLRASLPPDIVRELDRIRRYVAVLARPRGVAAPLLSDLYHAALDGTHLRVVYDSKSGTSDRVIFPFGLYLAAGFWYCACYDERRRQNLGLRADRFLAAERISGYQRPPALSLADWLAGRERDDGNGLPLRIRVTARGMKSYELEGLFGPAQPDGHGGGLIEGSIPSSEIEWFAARLLSVGTDARVQSPPALIAAIRRQAEAVAAHYPP